MNTLNQENSESIVWFFIPEGWPLKPGLGSMHNPLDPYRTEADALNVRSFYGPGSVISRAVRVANITGHGLKEKWDESGDHTQSPHQEAPDAK